ncbi:MAG: hypothetical protein QMD07_03070 [Thermodesulfovibrionales bacterium]|nr:hypothetical protein [Thermodesulfovibrionales bacterium]
MKIIATGNIAKPKRFFDVIARSIDSSSVIARDEVPKQSQDRLGTGSAISKDKIATPSARNDGVEVF